jgi:crossover junction endodeoxyribonuclease RusA
MAKEIRFVVFGTAVPKGSMKAFYVKKLGRAIVTHDNTATKPWAQQVTGSALAARNAQQPLEGAISVELGFYLPRPKSLAKKAVAHLKKPDIDKLARNVIDALTGVLFVDDAQVIRLDAWKTYAGGHADHPDGVPRAVISVRDLAVGGDQP